MKTSEITVIFTDTHFGVKQNSITWLNSQLSFIYDQLIPFIKSKKDTHKIRLIHLGDVFDSRSTISTMVATKVVEAMRDLRSIVDKFYIIAGNHDFYSPVNSEVDTISLLLKDLDINLVIDSIEYDDRDALIPWYRWGDDLVDNIDRVFAHTDIVTQKPIYKGVEVFSGHEHIPMIKKNLGLYNIGSCYALNFADANQERGFYVLENRDLTFVPNTKSIKFWRLYNEDILDPTNQSKIKPFDYIELYVSQENMLKDDYITVINNYSKKYKNIWIIPQTRHDVNDVEKFSGYNINDIIKSMIPEELSDKFNTILEKSGVESLND